MIFIADTTHPLLISKLRNLDNVLLVKNSIALYKGIQNHVDLQICQINNHLFVTRELYTNMSIEFPRPYKLHIIEEPLGKSYPGTAQLNVVSNKKSLIANLKIINKDIIDTAKTLNLEIIHVNQGYVRCTTIPLISDTYITDDPGIAKTLISSNKQVLLIKQGHIALDNHPYGFIGGSAGIVNNVLYFNGDITQHPDYQSIKQFCNTNSIQIDWIPEKPLKDIGGIIQI